MEYTTLDIPLISSPFMCNACGMFVDGYASDCIRCEAQGTIVLLHYATPEALAKSVKFLWISFKFVQARLEVLQGRVSKMAGGDD